MDDGTLTIGDLARLGGVPVKTVRFYSDRGLLPDTDRSPGGHRRYGADALERLRRIRELRALDLPLDEVTRALEGDEALSAALAARLAGVRDTLTALRWQEASLHALTSAPPEEQPELLRLFGALPQPPTTDTVVAFWKLTCPVGLPARVRDAFLGTVVPELPHAPTPGQTVAYARLHAYTSDLAFATRVRRDQRGSATGPCDGAPLYEGVLEAYALAASAAAAGRTPAPGHELDAYVGAFGTSRGERDTADFRAALLRETAWTRQPRVARYWSLADEVSPGTGTTGAALDWLLRALEQSVTGAGDAPREPMPPRAYQANQN
ncbi:MerR family transcriptional regulator [Streptomyces sp. UNOC14_S4]|uniref:MerR family transcriptional regulator n=1 Tax=Streptomyces sp. UNOC14_S4 TaxID=2872340 RepID=UPI001E46697B|nr:MerR family transcriptional regulator [Streptomyces sp. UNOC14_S4]MCC3770172.1 MerR family transcriptional regulator [Streptomyces sp. UNOC14_S4]